jgi:glycine cleavage system pyridoxal-binding protein P
MSTTAKAASNGSTDQAAAAVTTGQPERITGMAQVREAETYHAASVLNEAACEAERLCTAVYRAVTDAYFKDVRHNADSDGRTATETAESPEIRGKAEEALNCLHAAECYLRRLLTGYEPPF